MFSWRGKSTGVVLCSTGILLSTAKEPSKAWCLRSSRTSLTGIWRWHCWGQLAYNTMANQCGQHRIATRWKGLLATSALGWRRCSKKNGTFPTMWRSQRRNLTPWQWGPCYWTFCGQKGAWKKRGELALTAHVSPGEVVHEWHGAGQIGMNFIQVQRWRCCWRSRKLSSHAWRKEWKGHRRVGRKAIIRDNSVRVISFTHVAPFRCISWFSIG